MTVISKKTPAIVLTDKNGVIIHYNEAAHDVCAALCIGDNIESFIDKVGIDDYNRALLSGLYSFSVPSVHIGIDSLLFDLTREKTDGVRTVYLNRSSAATTSEVSYGEVAQAFEKIADDTGFSGKRRFAELYDTLISANSVFGSHRHRGFYPLRAIMARYTNTILPRHLYTSGDIVYAEEDSVTDDSVIFAEPYGFYLLLCAVTAVATHISDGVTEIKVRDVGDRAVITVTADCSCPDKYRISADFGVRAIDLHYAKTLCSVCGHSITQERNRDNDGIVFTITVKCHDYYPSYLKTEAGADFVLDAVAASVSYPTSANEEDSEHN